ncbi:Hypothetical predicted protein, partial [Podarcis lilfordi]
MCVKRLSQKPKRILEAGERRHCNSVPSTETLQGYRSNIWIPLVNFPWKQPPTTSWEEKGLLLCPPLWDDQSGSRLLTAPAPSAAWPGSSMPSGVSASPLSLSPQPPK